jgi:hypothetical protein
MPENDVRLVREGYTVSDDNAAFGRIGPLYVMRDNEGHRIGVFGAGFFPCLTVVLEQAGERAPSGAWR